MEKQEILLCSMKHSHMYKEPHLTQDVAQKCKYSEINKT